MNKVIFILPLLALTSCSTVTRLNNLIDQSSYAIEANREAVDRSTEVIHRNRAVIEQSNKAIEENRKHLETLSAS
jgi:hypothetical protein